MMTREALWGPHDRVLTVLASSEEGDGHSHTTIQTIISVQLCQGLEREKLQGTLKMGLGVE